MDMGSMSMSGMMGTDMSGMMEMGGSTMGGMMKPWLHFTMGDNLFFMAWVPVSAGAVVGACIGLFLLAIVERWVAAMRAVMQTYWTAKTKELLAARLTPRLTSDSDITLDKKYSNETRDADMESLPTRVATPPPGRIATLRRTTPFIPAHDFARGAVHACQAALGYTLMLAVMTFHAGYIIAIIAGLGVGEVLFGRFGAATHH